MVRLLAASVLLLFVTLATAQGQGSSKPNGVFLVARPDLADSNFSRTVVLVTQTEDFSTVGVILNRPTPLKLAQLEPGLETGKYRDAVYFGGPVMVRSLVAVFLSETRPPAAAFHVLPKLYMTLHPDNVKMLVASEGRRYRLYAGFSGWAPRQLENEFDREGWLVLPADADTVFRADTAGLWEELVERVRALKTRHKTNGPAEGGAGVARLAPDLRCRAAHFLWRKATVETLRWAPESFGPVAFSGPCPNM